MRTYLPWLYPALALAQAAHSIEEVLTGLWRWMPVVSGAVREHIGFVPIIEWSGQGFAIANMILIALMLAFSPLPFLNRTWAWSIATIVAVIETVNGINHLSAAFVTRGYFPGCITAVLLLALSIPIWGRKWLFRKGTR